MVWHQRRTDLGGAAVVLLRARMFWENRSSAHFQSLPYWANLSLVDGRLFVQDSLSGFEALRTDDMIRSALVRYKTSSQQQSEAMDACSWLRATHTPLGPEAI